MIVRSLCNSCFQTYSLLLQESDIALVKQIADENGQTCPCPRLCGGRINLVGTTAIDTSNLRLRDPMNLTGKELYQAVNGAGLPDEIEKGMEIIESLLKAYTITGVSLEDVNGRVYLHELILSNGMTIHLSAGARGAQVLKITKEHSHGPRSNSGDTGENRAQD